MPELTLPPFPHDPDMSPMVRDWYDGVRDQLQTALTDLDARIQLLTSVNAGNLVQATDTGDLEDTGQSTPDGSIVGTTDAQTLTQKTITSPVVTDPTVTDGTFANPAIDEPDITWKVLTITDASYTLSDTDKDAAVVLVNNHDAGTITFPSEAGRIYDVLLIAGGTKILEPGTITIGGGKPAWVRIAYDGSDYLAMSQL